MVTRPVFCPVLIGRNEEFRELAERRLASARGHGYCVVVTGEAGIGKSRLLATLRERVTGGRAAFGLGLARQFGNAPYEPVLTALSGLGCRVTLSPQLDRHEQLAALSEAIATACSRRSCVLAIEDLQWADENSLRFLLYLLPLVATMRLLVVLTYRSDAIDETEAAAHALARVQRDSSTHVITLEPLKAAQMRELLVRAMGPKLKLPVEALDEIAQRSEGNPFFAQELLKNALERQATNGERRGLPLSIRGALLERCASLDDATRDVLAHAAVIGLSFNAAFLSRVCGKPPGDVLSALRRLRQMQIVDERDDEREAFAFRHALTRDAVYATMLKEEAKPLHRRILVALEATGGSAHDLGYHAWAAGDKTRTIGYNERAGDEAAALYAHADAYACYERAFGGANKSSDRARLLEKAAAAAANDGHAERATSLYGQALAAYGSSLKPGKASKLSLAMSSQARHSGNTLTSREILRSALVKYRPSARDRARILHALAFTYIDAGETDDAAALLSEAAALAETPTHYNALIYLAAMRGDLAGLREASAACLEFSARGAAGSLLQARFNVAFDFCALGLDDEALPALELLLPEVRERRLTSLEVLTCANAALIHARGGRSGIAAAMVERGLALPELTTTAPTALAAAGVTVALSTGDGELVLRLVGTQTLERALSCRINSMLGRLAGPYARWLHVRGNVEEARELLRNAMAALATPFAATETLTAAIELGDTQTRAAVLAMLPAMDAMATLPLYSATGAHIRSFVAMQAGNPSGACDHAAAAAAHYRELRWPAHERSMLQIIGERSLAGESSALAGLSAREREIATLVAQGIPNKSLATRLSVSQRTIEKHLTAIFDKLGVRNRTELSARVMRAGIGG